MGLCIGRGTRRRESNYYCNYCHCERLLVRSNAEFILEQREGHPTATRVNPSGTRLGSSQPASQPARARAETVTKSWVRTADAARFSAQKETSCVEVQPSAELVPRPCRLPVTRWGRLFLH